MTERTHTPGPWTWWTSNSWKRLLHDLGHGRSANVLQPYVCHDGHPDCEVNEANMLLIAAAPDLLEAAVLLEKAEDAHANCEECEGEDMPELCERCFPLFDDARIKRRLAIAKATGKKSAPDADCPTRVLRSHP